MIHLNSSRPLTPISRSGNVWQGARPRSLGKRFRVEILLDENHASTKGCWAIGDRVEEGQFHEHFYGPTVFRYFSSGA